MTTQRLSIETPQRGPRRRHAVAAIVVALAMGASSSGCGRSGWELFGAAVETVAYVAVTAMVLAAHDHHYHDAYCGHTYVIYEHHPVYYYSGRWEYYDASARSWYYYPHGIGRY